MFCGLVTTLLLVLCHSSAASDELEGGLPKEKHFEKRSLLTFPPDSILQITMGITVSGKLKRNSGAIVLAFQQNAPLPGDAQPLLAPSLVVSGRQFSIYDHLRDVISSYGFDGFDCLRKMICQIGEAPLPGGLLEDLVTFVLTPSKHRSGPPGKWSFLLDSEEQGKLGGNCTFAFPKCVRTPLDMVSSFLHE